MGQLLFLGSVILIMMILLGICLGLNVMVKVVCESPKVRKLFYMTNGLLFGVVMSGILLFMMMIYLKTYL